MKKIIFIVSVLVCLAACTNKTNLSIKEADVLYKEAIEELKFGNYGQAAKKFEEIDVHYPTYSRSTDAIIMAAYSYHKAKKYMESSNIIEYYIKYFASRKEICYIMYLDVMNYYSLIQNIGRLPEVPKNGYKAAKRAIETCKDTKYATEINEKLLLFESHLVGNELDLARTNLESNNFTGALQHLHIILNSYPNTPYLDEVYYRFVEIYNYLGYQNGVNEYINLLRYKFRNSQWLKLAEELL